MTREEAREKWEVIKAYGEGKTIQFYGASGEWFDVGEGFELPIEEKLRIKEKTMFEKEDFDKYMKDSEDYYDNREPMTERKLYQLWKDGAEFGYNKANEWHFVKDGDLPKENKKYWVLTSDREPRVDSWLNISWVNSYDVIAWKEIVLPQESE